MDVCDVGILDPSLESTDVAGVSRVLKVVSITVSRIGEVERDLFITVVSRTGIVGGVVLINTVSRTVELDESVFTTVATKLRRGDSDDVDDGCKNLGSDLIDKISSSNP